MLLQYLQYNMGVLHICHTPHTIYCFGANHTFFIESLS